MKIRIVAVSVSFVLAGLANADLVDVQYNGTQKGLQVHLTSSLYTGDVFAGQMKHELTNGPAAYNGNWITFCTDLAQHVTGSPKQYTIVSVDQMPDSGPMGAAKAAAIRDMYAYAAGSQLLGTTTNDLAAAFQLAIWEVITDYNPNMNGLGLDITSGGLVATKTNGDALSNGVMTQLGNLFGAIGHIDSASTSLVGLKSGEYQDQIIQVPAPGAIAFCGLALGFARRRRA